MSANVLSHRQTAYICRNLCALIHAGFTAGDACHLLADEETGDLHTFFQQLGYETDAGTALFQALLNSNRFPRATARLIAAGEQTGHLEEAMTAAADYHETRDRTSRQLRSALGYPMVLLTVMLIVIGILLIRVLPVFDSVYASLGCSMTGIAALLLHFGQKLRQILPLLCTLLLFLAVVLLACRLYPPFRQAAISVLYPLWDDRCFMRDFHNARFLLALSMGIRSGLVPEESIALAADMMKYSPGAYSRCRACLQEIRNGISFSDALLKGKLINSYGARLLKVSAASGNIDKVAAELAENMQEQAENRLQDILAKIEPGIVLLSSVLIGLILLSVMLPLMQVLSALS